MRGLSQSVIANEDRLVAIYRRTGDTQFTHSEIADLIPCGTMLRYTVPGIFIRARDSKGVPLKGGSRARSNVWRWHPRAAELCRQAIERDHRWENLANGLTGRSECA
jgi:hypothetical protein